MILFSLLLVERFFTRLYRFISSWKCVCVWGCLRGDNIFFSVNFLRVNGFAVANSPFLLMLFVCIVEISAPFSWNKIQSFVIISQFKKSFFINQTNCSEWIMKRQIHRKARNGKWKIDKDAFLVLMNGKHRGTQEEI